MNEHEKIRIAYQLKKKYGNVQDNLEAYSGAVWRKIKDKVTITELFNFNGSKFNGDGTPKNPDNVTESERIINDERMVIKYLLVT